MKTVTNNPGKSNPEEEKRFKQRVYYFEKVKGLPHEEAVRLATKKHSPATPPGELTPWKQRQLAKKKGQAQPLKLHECPLCLLAFYAGKAGERPEPISLDNCPGCHVKFWYTE